MKKKTIALLMVAILLSLSVACGQGNIENQDFEKMLQEAFEKSKLWESFSMNTLSYVSTEALSEDDNSAYTEYSTTGDVFLNPLKARIVVSMQLADMSNAMTITQYLEKSDKGINVYQEVSSAWIKYEMTGDNLSALMGADPMGNLELIMNHIVDISYEGEEVALKRDAYKLKVTVESRMFKEQMEKGQGLGLSSYIGELEGMGAGLDGIENLVYYIYIDKETGEIDKYETDMSQIINTLAEKMLETQAIDAEQGNQLRSAKMVLKVDLYNQNAVEEFEISPAIKESARQVELEK